MAVLIRTAGQPSNSEIYRVLLLPSGGEEGSVYENVGDDWVNGEGIMNVNFFWVP